MCLFLFSLVSATRDFRDDLELTQFFTTAKYLLQDVMEYWVSCVMLVWGALGETSYQTNFEGWNEIYFDAMFTDFASPRAMERLNSCSGTN